MVENQDPLSDFVGDLAEKIKLAKDHKQIMDAVKNPVVTEPVTEQSDPFVNLLQKIGNAVTAKLPVKASSDTVQAEPVTETMLPEATDEAAAILGQKIKMALEQVKIKTSENMPVAETDDTDAEQAQAIPVPGGELVDTDDVVESEEPIKSLGQKIKDAIEQAKNKALHPTSTEHAALSHAADDDQIAGYIEELEKIKDTGTVKQQETAKTTLQEIKDYIDKTVKDYSRRILDLGGGGGSVAQQFAHGGTMDGTLNVTGHILSGGKNIANYFGSGGGGGDPAVNTVVYTNSGNWNSTYTTVNTYSGAWSTGLQTIAFDEDTAQLSISYGNTISLSALSGSKGTAGDPAVNTAVYTGSAKWNSNYTTSNYFSAFWNAAVDELFTFYVTQTDPGSAFISEDGNYYVIANSKLDNVDLWNTAYTQIYLLSSRWDSVYVTVLGNSARWESVYTSLNQNSGRYESTYTTTNRNSGNWSSTYNTYKSLSASYAAETLAIAYAVAL